MHKGTTDQAALPGAGHPINIPEGASLQAPVITHNRGFSDQVYQNLPDILKTACEVLTEQNEREVFLAGALGIVSGILPNVRGFYDGNFVYPQLFVYVVGPYGTGKGGLKFAYKLGEQIHKKRRELSAQLEAKYKQECREAKDNHEDEPEQPGRKVLYMPANNSKSGLLDLMAENDGRGILFETEGDTLADALKTDYGGFSDLLRKVFHHERVSMNRRTSRELKEVENPALAVVLSSTPDQLQKLIPNVQNGLFSRFLYYRITPTPEFRNVFDTKKRAYPEHFDSLGQTFSAINDYLNTLAEPIEFRLTERQQGQFLEIFQQWKNDISENISTDLDGTINRLGLICFRVAMVLTALRNFEQGDYSKTMTCVDADFDNALTIVETLKRHAVSIYYDLPNPPISREAAEFEREQIDKAAQIALAKRYSNEGKGVTEIARLVLGDPSKKSKIAYWLSKL